jgi:hypothetical protein
VNFERLHAVCRGDIPFDNPYKREAERMHIPAAFSPDCSPVLCMRYGSIKKPGRGITPGLGFKLMKTEKY